MAVEATALSVEVSLSVCSSRAAVIWVRVDRQALIDSRPTMGRTALETGGAAQDWPPGEEGRAASFLLVVVAAASVVHHPAQLRGVLLCPYGYAVDSADVQSRGSDLLDLLVQQCVEVAQGWGVEEEGEEEGSPSATGSKWTTHSSRH